MPALKRSDLNYNDYSWTAVPGDDPTKTKEDRDKFSRKEGYEVVTLLNALSASGGGDLPVRSRQIAEWMIHEHLPSNIQGRSKVIAWIVANFSTMKAMYPF